MKTVEVLETEGVIAKALGLDEAVSNEGVKDEIIEDFSLEKSR